ncbi:MAG: Nif3-like dinuclear metal center hexameric protein [Actinobacteria bacterium]|nr:Nif3-like dinuclear metal center hexameric protein [Actinomycetota bacterium]
MKTVQDILTMFDTIAPLSLAAKWDSVGLQIGDPNAVISKVIVASEVTPALLDRLAQETGVLVLTHHPVFFKPIRQLHYGHDMGQIIRAFVSNGHHLISLHTNLDAAKGGVNDVLLSVYGLDREEGLAIDEGIGRWFSFDQAREFSLFTKAMPHQCLGARHDGPVSRLGGCAGSAHGLMTQVRDLNLDCLITGEIHYHDDVFAQFHQIRVIQLGHYESEVLVLPHLKTWIEEAGPGLEVQVFS